MRQKLVPQPRFAGVASVTAMVFLVIISTLALAMIGLARTNSQISTNQSYAEQARSNAEAGMRWIAWKFNSVTMPPTDIGYINSDLALKLWSNNSPSITSALLADINAMNATALPSKGVMEAGAAGNTRLHIPNVFGGPSGTNDINFEILAEPKDAGQYQVITVTSIGKYRNTTRNIEMKFLIQKGFQNGVVSRIPVQLGKNTTVDGDILVYANATKNNQAPVLSISDFLYTGVGTSNVDMTNITKAYYAWLKGTTGGKSNNPANDNRINLSDSVGLARLASLQGSNSLLANATDMNHDGFLDEYDLFLQYFDRNGNGSVDKTEFTNYAPNDRNLFNSIDDWMGAPINPDPKVDPPRPGLSDKLLNSSDPYAKVKGTIRMNATAAAVTSATGQSLADVMQGSFSSRDGYSPAVVFGYDPSSDPAAQITAANFNMLSFLNNAGSAAGAAIKPGTLTNPDNLGAAANTSTFANTNVASTDANGTADANIIAAIKAGGTNPQTTTRTFKVNGVSQTVSVLTTITENVPYGVPDSARRSTCTRKVFSGMTFKNCIINRGTNALFVNCRFDGVTFVDGSTSMGSNYALGNNFRFQDCTFTGPLAQGDVLASGSDKAAAPSTYTDYTNSWEFNGATTIDFSMGNNDKTADSQALSDLKKQATIMAPQTNIEMGSFTSPDKATCSFNGVIVAGCFDVRGTANIVGTIIVVGGDVTNPQGSAGGGNCTLGYFGPNDSSTNAADADPSTLASGAAYGRIHITFDPRRSLPDGIKLNVSLVADPLTWKESN